MYTSFTVSSRVTLGDTRKSMPVIMIIMIIIMIIIIIIVIMIVIVILKVVVVVIVTKHELRRRVWEG